jgi:sortase A
MKDKQQKKDRKKKKASLSTIILVLIMIVGFSVLSYPFVSDYWNQFHQTRAINNYVAAVDEMDDADYDAMLRAAQDYNARLVENPNRYFMTDEERAEYESLLNVGGDGIMGYIQIPRIGVSLPIYHGTSELVLNTATGHIEGSSLPVDGETVHAALSGHRGLPTAKLFTDLDELAEGDTFTVTVLKEVMTFRVDQIHIVLPNEMQDLEFSQGEDYCTLITCTPYGINTHRLLVRGRRVDGADLLTIPPDAIRIPSYIILFAVMIPLLFVSLVILLILYRKPKPRPTFEEVVEAAEHAQKRKEEEK